MLLASVERPEARHQPRLGRKGREQALGEGVDGLDAQAAAGRVEHAREQGPRPLTPLRPRILVEREQLLAELGILEPDPMGQPGMDALGHLGRARLGEGEAQDRGRIDARRAASEAPGR